MERLGGGVGEGGGEREADGGGRQWSVLFAPTKLNLTLPPSDRQARPDHGMISEVIVKGMAVQPMTSRLQRSRRREAKIPANLTREQLLDLRMAR